MMYKKFIQLLGMALILLAVAACSREAVPATDGEVTISPQQLPTLLAYFIEGFDATKWEIVGNGKLENNTITLTAAYKDKLTAGDSVEIFNKVKMPANVTSADLEGSTFTDSYIEIQAAAIQADGFDSYVDAGNALAEQWGMGF